MIGQKGVPALYGGIERHVEELSLRLAGNGHEVLVYCRPWYSQTQTKEKWYRGIRLITLFSVKTKHLDAITHTFISTLHALREDVDIFHYHGVGPALLSFLPRVFRPNAKVVVTFHCIDRKHKKWNAFARFILRLGERAACLFAHETIAVSRTLQHYCATVYDCPASYIPNGVAVFGEEMQADLIQKQFGLEPDGYVLMVARLVAHKGAHHLIEAFRNIATDKKLVIAGDSAFTDNYVKYLYRLAEGDDRIIFTGWQAGKMLHELFSNANFVVHPSESEGLPIAILEAMGYGKTVLAADIPENMEVIAEHGVRFENKNVKDLQITLEALLRESETSLRERGERAKQFVNAEYNWDVIAENTIGVYEKSLGVSEFAAQKAI